MIIYKTLKKTKLCENQYFIKYKTCTDSNNVQNINFSVLTLENYQLILNQNAFAWKLSTCSALQHVQTASFKIKFCMQLVNLYDDID